MGVEERIMGDGGGLTSKKPYIVVIVIASLLELWYAAVICDNINDSMSDCKKEPAWAVACGAISLVFMIVILALAQFASGQADGVPGQILLALTWIIWLCGVGAYTFGSAKGGLATAQIVANNGWFGTWICFITCTILILDIPTVKGLVDKVVGAMDNKKYMAIVGLASLVVMWHAAKVCDDQTECKKMP